MATVGKLKIGEKNVYMACALNESYKPKDATEWVDQTVWVDVVAFGAIIGKIEKAGIQVGDGVLIIGKLAQREYEGKRYLQVIAQKVQLVAKSKKNGGATADDADPLPVTKDNESEATKPAVTNDDLPF